MTSGELLIRDAVEPFQILLPTTISGTNTDGQLSGIDFQTPTISFVQDVPDYGTQAFIDAAFSTVGSGSGTINEDGDVVVQIAVAVDLHIVVPLLTRPSDCRAAPINLTLVSVAPYDGESVTLRAPNFSIPEVPDGSGCSDLVAPAINEILAGNGHLISMTLAGDVTLPVAGEPTTTSLTVAPTAGARVGQEITLSALVTAEEAQDAPVAWSGTMTFYDGSTFVGSSDVAAGGTAVLTTTGLPAGDRRLRAVYSGAPPDWRPSTSATVAYTVSAPPLISTDLAGDVVIGGADKDFTVAVRNTGMGTELENAQVDLRIFRTSTFTSVPLPVVLSRIVDGAATPVALTQVGVELHGSIESDAWRVPAGSEHAETLRLSVPAGTGPGPVRVVASLVTVEGETVVPLSSAAGDIMLVPEVRVATSITAGAPAQTRPPPLPSVPALPAVTPVVRQGTVAEVSNLQILPVQASLRPTGTWSFTIGGRPVPARFSTAASLAPWAPEVPTQSNAGSFHLVVPSDMALGEQLVQARYSGDAIYAGSVASWSVRIEPALGAVYDCVFAGVRSGRFLANVEALVRVPPVAAKGTEIPLARVEATMHMSRTRYQVLDAPKFVSADTIQSFSLTGGGAGTFATVTQTGATGMDVNGTPPIDWTITLTQGAGSLPVAHEAGTTEDIELEGITFDVPSGGFLFEVNCVPFAEAGVRVGSVTSTGTSLTVNPAETVRQGDTVELTAQALPVSPGVVEFLDGETTVGVSPADAQGFARVSVEGLAPGVRRLTARFFGTVYPDSTSDPVELTVDRVECLDIAAPGNAAVVRLVYLTVLDRCPDQAGFDYWTGRLDAGATRESVARAIAASHEARKVLVDEAYGLMLGRRADAEGKEFWATRLGRTGSYRDLIGQLGSSPEFRTLAGGTDTRVVERLYDRLLHRTPSAEDTAYWVGQIQARGTRATVIKMFDLDEPLRTLVGDTYRTIVDRAPTTTERDTGVALMRDRSDRAALNAQAINTNDFYTRAQSFPNPG